WHIHGNLRRWRSAIGHVSLSHRNKARHGLEEDGADEVRAGSWSGTTRPPLCSPQRRDGKQIQTGSEDGPVFCYGFCTIMHKKNGPDKSGPLRESIEKSID